MKTYNVERLLATSLLDHCEQHESLTSTNDRARELANERPDAGLTLVLAEEQTAGRGRGSNRWWTGRGSIAGSLLFDPGKAGIPRERRYLLSLATALAIVDLAAPRLAPRTIGIHWPNDVYVGGFKLAGVLVEALSDGRHIVGFGININNTLSAAPAELQSRAATFADLTGREFDRTELVADFLAHWSHGTTLLATDAPRVGRRAHEACLQVGARLTIVVGEERTQGICAGIASDGALLLDTPTGRRPFYSGVLA